LAPTQLLLVVVPSTRARGIPKDGHLAQSREGRLLRRRPRVAGEFVDAKIILAIAGFLDQHALLLNLRKVDHQVAGQWRIRMPGFGNVALTPLTELEANRAALLNDGLGLGFYHFEAQVKLGEILFEIERQLVVTAFGI